MPWKGDSAHDKSTESECREHGVGVGHLEEGGFRLESKTTSAEINWRFKKRNTLTAILISVVQNYTLRVLIFDSCQRRSSKSGHRDQHDAINHIQFLLRFMTYAMKFMKYLDIMSCMPPCRCNLYNLRAPA